MSRLSLSFSGRRIRDARPAFGFGIPRLSAPRTLQGRLFDSNGRGSPRSTFEGRPLDRRGRECESQVVRRLVAFVLALLLVAGMAGPGGPARCGTGTQVALRPA